MTNNEGRIVKLEVLWGAVRDGLRKLLARVDNLDQQIRQTSSMSYGWGGAGSSTGYVAVTDSFGIAAATGPPPGGTPGTATCDIYKVTFTGYDPVGARTVCNPYLDATDPVVKVLTVAANEDGSFTLLGESCT